MCFVCNQTYTVETAIPLYSDLRACPECGAAFGESVSAEDERYILLISLCLRAAKSGERKDRFQYSVEGTQRELSILKEGDKCDVDGIKGRISDHNPTTGKIQVFLSRNKISSNGEVIISAIDE